MFLTISSSTRVWSDKLFFRICSSFNTLHLLQLSLSSAGVAYIMFGMHVMLRLPRKRNAMTAKPLVPKQPNVLWEPFLFGLGGRSAESRQWLGQSAAGDSRSGGVRKVLGRRNRPPRSSKPLRINPAPRNENIQLLLNSLAAGMAAGPRQAPASPTRHLFCRCVWTSLNSR